MVYWLWENMCGVQKMEKYEAICNYKTSKRFRKKSDNVKWRIE